MSSMISFPQRGCIFSLRKSELSFCRQFAQIAPNLVWSPLMQCWTCQGVKLIFKRPFDNSSCPKVDPGLRSRASDPALTVLIRFLSREAAIYDSNPAPPGFCLFLCAQLRYTWKNLSESSNFNFATFHFWPVQPPPKAVKPTRFWRYWFEANSDSAHGIGRPSCAICGHTHSFKKSPLEWNDLLERNLEP